LRFPHFVGTFDAFLNRYFVLPFEIDGVKRPYHVVDSWTVYTFHDCGTNVMNGLKSLKKYKGRALGTYALHGRQPEVDRVDRRVTGSNESLQERRH
jgi:hypothetical protein